MNCLLQKPYNLSRTQNFTLNEALFLVQVLESSVAFVFHSFWQGLACGATKTLSETNA